MTKYVLWAVILACLASLIAVPVAAQNTFKTAGVKVPSASADSNVKNDNALNSPDQKIPPPTKKGGPAAKGNNGLTCDGHVDNRTPYYVRYYVNGSLEAVIGPYGDYYPAYTWGTASLYARAVFDNGFELHFGPRDYVCAGQDFTWSLTP